MIKTQIANLILILITESRKQYICTFQIISNFHIGQIDGEVIVIFRSSNQEQFWKSDFLKS